MSQRVHPTGDEPNEQSRDDLIRQRDRYAGMAKDHGDEVASATEALRVTDLALESVLDFLHTDGPLEATKSSVEAIVQAAHLRARAILGA